MQKTHSLKCSIANWEAIRLGLQTFDVRRDDPVKQKPYEAGDLLHLCEWDPSEIRFTGRRLFAAVTTIQRLWEPPSGWGQSDESIDPHGRTVVMGIRVLEVDSPNKFGHDGDPKAAAARYLGIP